MSQRHGWSRSRTALAAAALMVVSSLATVAQAHEGRPQDSASDSPDGTALGRAGVAARPTASRTTGPTLPNGFRDKAVIRGLDEPTNVAFAPDGRIFVTEKGGTIWVYTSTRDTAPLLVADLNKNVMNNYDRGLLGLALDPGFPTVPYVYVSYTYDHELGSSAPAPKWGVGQAYDDCPDPPDGPGETDGGCEVSGRVSRLTVDARGVMKGPEQVLVEDWCMQFPSHAVGSLVFGPEGMLYASGGEGASYDYEDYGQDVVKGDGIKNPCNDPDHEGGSLRAQDRRTSGDPTGLSGAVIRIDPATGLAPADNPLSATGQDENEKRIIADGMRNPFRFTFQPGTGDLFLGDVGSYFYEEINKIPTVDDTPGSFGAPPNFGWPCYEGPKKNQGWVALENKAPICQGLYADRSTTKPFFAYQRYGQVAPGASNCHIGSSAVSGLAFTTGAAYPARYRDALAFSDYARGCIWVFGKRVNGSPDPTSLTTLVDGAASPVNVLTGPDGDLYYVELGVNNLGYPTSGAGAIHRIHYYAGNQPPEARIKASTNHPALYEETSFDASASSDPDGDELFYEWDTDDDGRFDDATGKTTSRSFSTPDKTYRVAVRVWDRDPADPAAESDVASMLIYADDTPPELEVSSPTKDLTWRVGQKIHLSATASDAEDGDLPGEQIAWRLAIRHCPSICHTHPTNAWVSQPEVDFRAPDHEFPSYLLLTASATDYRGLTTTKTFTLEPKATRLTFRTSPARLRLVVGGSRHRSVWKQTFIEHGQFTLSAPRIQKRAGKKYVFRRWTDGGNRTHVVSTPRRAREYRAIYRRR